MKIVGASLVVLGLAALLFGGIPYKKTESVAQFGDFKMNVTEKKQVAIPPILSGLVVLAGAALFFAGSRKPPA